MQVSNRNERAAVDLSLRFNEYSHLASGPGTGNKKVPCYGRADGLCDTTNPKKADMGFPVCTAR
jgi:hypothetical protein